jgi:hypothetical protein
VIVSVKPIDSRLVSPLESQNESPKKQNISPSAKEPKSFTPPAKDSELTSESKSPSFSSQQKTADIPTSPKQISSIPNNPVSTLPSSPIVSLGPADETEFEIIEHGRIPESPFIENNLKSMDANCSSTKTTPSKPPTQPKEKKKRDRNSTAKKKQQLANLSKDTQPIGSEPSTSVANDDPTSSDNIESEYLIKMEQQREEEEAAAALQLGETYGQEVLYFQIRNLFKLFHYYIKIKVDMRNAMPMPGFTGNIVHRSFEDINPDINNPDASISSIHDDTSLLFSTKDVDPSPSDQVFDIILHMNLDFPFSRFRVLLRMSLTYA